MTFRSASKVCFLLIGCMGLVCVSAPVFGAPFTLTTGVDDGDVSLGVDGFGAFGLAVGADSTDATYNPVGPGAPAVTTFESGVAIGFGGARSFLTSGGIGGSGGLANPTVSGTSLSGTSSFTFGDLSFDLVQTVTEIFDGGMQTGSLLTQEYTITNTGSAALDFELVRYLDGDLRFDGSLIDGGGRLTSPSEILFETDSATGSSDETTFLGITGEGGTSPATNRYEIDSFSGLRTRIIAGTALDNTVTGDGGDADQFIDTGAGYDVTLALRNTFSLAVDGTTSYTTTTIFGSGSPDDIGIPEPGSTALFGLGLAGVLLGVRRNRKRKKAAV